jgi:hypothetical protein
MPCTLSISLHQQDDGDGLARFLIQASNNRFSCATVVWSCAETFAELATAIKGFPVSASSKVNFQFGSHGVGECALSFSCVDGSGHAVVWVSVEDEYPVQPTLTHQTAKLCLRIEASAVDDFVAALAALSSGSTTSAVLYGNEP